MEEEQYTFRHDISKVGDIIIKYLKGQKLTDDESQELDAWKANSVSNQKLFEHLANGDISFQEELALYAKAESEKFSQGDKVIEGLFPNAVEEISPFRRKGRVISIRSLLKYAAAIILIASAISYWYFVRTQKTDIAKTTINTIPAKTDIAPGGNKAVLVLGNNEQIDLSNASNGNVAQQGNTKVVKTADGELKYQTSGTKSKVYFNTVITPKGGQYQLTLPDGSKVWMNAASSLRFPTVFAGNERMVELTGEAYFEVAPSTSLRTGAKMPFIVKLKNEMKVQVLGTHFNIMAYEEEKEIKTTLLEGAVKVSKASSLAMLQPGQQAVIANVSNEGQIKVIKNADIDEAVAWKNGLFNFNNADLKSVMRQLERWYDVEVEYQGNVSDFEFLGKIPRNMNLSQVLSIFQKQNVRFKIEGKKIIVSP
jgi:transmembrane sensor